jgi:hypothetical protein
MLALLSRRGTNPRRLCQSSSDRARVAGMPVPEVTSLSLGKAGVRALTKLLARATGVICVT